MQQPPHPPTTQHQPAQAGAALRHRPASVDVVSALLLKVFYVNVATFKPNIIKDVPHMNDLQTAFGSLSEETS